MDSRYCPHCEVQCMVREESRDEVLVVRGDPINVTAQVLVCNACGRDLPDPLRDDETLKFVYAEYRRKRGLLGPDAIRETRAKYGLSQRQLGRLLGWGVVTIQRYESGALQDSAHDQVLRQLDDPDFVLRQTRSPSCRLSASEAAALQLRLRNPSSSSSQSGPRSIAELVEGQLARKAQASPMLTGLSEFSLEKLAQVVHTILITAHGQVFKTKLAKLLWLTDFLFFAENTVSMTGLAYARLPHGPAPEDYSLLLTALEQSGVVEVVSEEIGDFSGDVISPAPCQPQPGLDGVELETIQRVIARFGGLSSSALSELTHNEPVWAQRANGEPIPYSAAREVQLVLQLLR